MNARMRLMSVFGLTVLVSVPFVSQAAYHGKTGKLPEGCVPGVYRDDDDYLLRKFREDVTDRSTGLDNAALLAGVSNIVAKYEGTEPWRVTKARAFAWLCDNVAIDCSEHDFFPAFSCWNRYWRPLRRALSHRQYETLKPQLEKAQQGARAGDLAGKYKMWIDFDHSVPEWEDILAKGWPGMAARLKANWKDDPYHRSLQMTLDATVRLLHRLSACASRRAKSFSEDSQARLRLTAEATALENLTKRPPQTVYEVLMFQYTYFIISEHLDHLQVRSLGAIDQLLTPYYRTDLAAGRIDEAKFRELLRHFWWQWGSIDNYWGQPVAVGATGKDGRSLMNEVTWIVLDIHDQLNIPTPKMLVKVAKTTPRKYLDKMLDMVRRNSSIVFVGEESLTRALKSWRGCTDEECRTSVLNGCYEVYVNGRQNVTQSAHLSFLQPVADLLDEAAKGTFAAANFDEFRAAYEKRLTDYAKECMDICDDWERYTEEINPANVYTLTSEIALRREKDAYFDGLDYNDSALLSVGLGTGVDALLAVKEIVYEKREMTLAGLGRLMAANWKGGETLRLRMLRSKRKWGVCNAEANALGRSVTKAVASVCNGRPDSRGGIWGFSGHPAMNFIWLPRHTGATPDGRFAGEEASKNCSPTIGMDTEGATAVVNTLAALDPVDLPVNLPLDMQLLEPTVRGEKGLQVLTTLTRTFLERGGLSIHFNVMNVETLKDAQAHPERYENLQVRICGWNAHWNDLSKAEQDSYIRRAENQAQ